ncbi:hypothetical protein NPIL_411381 [Nephila pilipes]|uniref:Uncharacterized protein n=1 Tax=Nephila pilipes TaxID=299642 RepID=A0A8X6MDU5_NEPPI|nr:hypothetical protein NPIL_411381 [Nephila pilipes]
MQNANAVADVYAEEESVLVADFTSRGKKGEKFATDKTTPKSNHVMGLTVDANLMLPAMFHFTSHKGIDLFRFRNCYTKIWQPCLTFPMTANLQLRIYHIHRC